jgi:hypothetical protein
MMSLLLTHGVCVWYFLCHLGSETVQHKLRKKTVSANSNTLLTLLLTYFRKEWPLSNIYVKLELGFGIFNGEGRKYIWFLKLVFFFFCSIHTAYIYIYMVSIKICSIVLCSVEVFSSF